MLHLNQESIIELVRAHGYVMIFGLTVIGSLGIPMPEETIVLVAGFCAREGVLSYPIVLLVCIVSAILGDNLGYWVGRTGGQKLLHRYGKFVGITEPKIQRFHAFFVRFGDA